MNDRDASFRGFSLPTPNGLIWQGKRKASTKMSRTREDFLFIRMRSSQNHITSILDRRIHRYQSSLLKEVKRWEFGALVRFHGQMKLKKYTSNYLDFDYLMESVNVVNVLFKRIEFSEMILARTNRTKHEFLVATPPPILKAHAHINKNTRNCNKKLATRDKIRHRCSNMRFVTRNNSLRDWKISVPSFLQRLISTKLQVSRLPWKYDRRGENLNVCIQLVIRTRTFFFVV